MKLAIRPIAKEELDAVWCVLAELRTHLSREHFRKALARQCDVHGYELIGAFEGGELLGVLGIRAAHTFARGAYLHVDDLVVSVGARGKGIGKRLVEYAEALARERGLGQVFLDSRPGAIGFYERLGYRRHESVLIKKRVDSSD